LRHSVVTVPNSTGHSAVQAVSDEAHLIILYVRRMCRPPRASIGTVSQRQAGWDCGWSAIHADVACQPVILLLLMVVTMAISTVGRRLLYFRCLLYVISGGADGCGRQRVDGARCLSVCSAVTDRRPRLHVFVALI